MNILLKILSKIWFPALVVGILIVFFYYDRMIAIYITIGSMVLIALSMVPFRKFFYNKIESQFFIKYKRIDHIEYALKAGLRPLDAERKMSDMVDAKLMKGKVIFAKPLYIYIHPTILSELKSYLEKGTDMKQIVSQFIEKYGFKNKKEIEVLIDTLKNEKKSDK